MGWYFIATILIVDDDPYIVNLLEDFLKAYEFKVIGTATDGQIAIDKFKSLLEKPDVILMDYRMPIKNGIEAAVEIRKLGYQSKIIFATADISIKEQAVKIGAHSVVNKPFSLGELMKTINEALGKEKI